MVSETAIALVVVEFAMLKVLIMSWTGITSNGISEAMAPKQGDDLIKHVLRYQDDDAETQTVANDLVKELSGYWAEGDWVVIVFSGDWYLCVKCNK